MSASDSTMPPEYESSEALRKSMGLTQENAELIPGFKNGKLLDDLRERFVWHEKNPPKVTKYDGTRASAYLLYIEEVPVGVTRDDLISFFSFDGIVPTDARVSKWSETRPAAGEVYYQMESCVLSALTNYYGCTWKGMELDVRIKPKKVKIDEANKRRTGGAPYDEDVIKVHISVPIKKFVETDTLYDGIEQLLKGIGDQKRNFMFKWPRGPVPGTAPTVPKEDAEGKEDFSNVNNVNNVNESSKESLVWNGSFEFVATYNSLNIESAEESRSKQNERYNEQWRKDFLQKMNVSKK